jgi:Flp pilus assembly protein TadG
MKSKSRFVSLLSWLGKNNQASRPRLLARLLRDEEGSYLIYGVALLPVLIGVSGLASEGGLLFYNHRTLQSAADGAAYSAAIAYSYDTSADITTQAKAIVASYGFALGTGNNQANVSATATTFAGQPAIHVTISRPQTALFSRMDALSVLSNNVSATAVLSSSKSGNCLLALGNTATGNNLQNSIAVQGNPSITVNGCGVFSNSTDCANGAVAVALGGNASITAGSVGSAGCISVTGSSEICTRTSIGTTCSPPGQSYTQQDGTLTDPYGTMPIPTTSNTGTCTATASSRCPGVYPNGLSLIGGTFTLQPGIYILESPLGRNGSANGPAFQVGQGGGNAGTGTVVTGSGVTLVFTSATPNNPSTYPSGNNNPIMFVASNGTLNLTAPSSGSTAGFVIMGDRTMPLGTTFDTHSNPNTCLDGTVYAPKGFFQWGGTPATGCTSTCLQMVVNQMILYGNSTFTNSGCTLSGGQKPIGSIVTLVQ